MDFPVVVSTAALISNALNSVKSARDLAKDASDIELRDQIACVYDTLQDLRERLLTLDDDNRKLRAELAAKTAYVGPLPPHGYFFASSDSLREHPICPACYQGRQQVGYMTDLQNWAGDLKRSCKLCRKSIFEREMQIEF